MEVGNPQDLDHVDPVILSDKISCGNGVALRSPLKLDHPYEGSFSLEMNDSQNQIVIYRSPISSGFALSGRENSPQLTQIYADTTGAYLLSVPANRGKVVTGALSASICVICGEKNAKVELSSSIGHLSSNINRHRLQRWRKQPHGYDSVTS
jgi:hypothetical protein